MVIDEREKLIQEILDQDRARMQEMQGDILPDWLNMDLTIPQLKIAMLLYSRPHGMRMSELASMLQKNISTATGVVDKLVEHGLVKREDDPDDRRAVIVTITEEGNRVFESIHQNKRDDTYAVLNRLELEQLKIVAQGMEIIFSAFESYLKEKKASKTNASSHEPTNKITATLPQR
jgi:DNA-binding MarR family transcriptional regulator